MNSKTFLYGCYGTNFSLRKGSIEKYFFIERVSFSVSKRLVKLGITIFFYWTRYVFFNELQMEYSNNVFVLFFFQIGEFQTTMTRVSRDVSPCSYIDRHSNDTHSKGRFFSPSYPQNYPSWSDCSYQFFGRPGEVVKLTFQVLQLAGNTTR